ncbi:MAG: arylsulfotransferase family protein, partial [Actinomycetes bacterium]
CTMAAGAGFSWQHDARRRSDGTLGLFDNAAGERAEAEQSRGLVLAVDESSRAVRRVREVVHPQRLLAETQGSMQELDGGASLVGWGARPYFSAHAADGTVTFAGHLPDDSVTYRVFQFPWRGLPVDRPAVAVRRAPDGAVAVHVSWNGATEVRRWRVRAGAQPDKLAVAGEGERTGFETAITIPRSAGYIVVDALDQDAQVVGSSSILTITGASTQ